MEWPPRKPVETPPALAYNGIMTSLLGVGLVSAAALLLQLALVRIFAIQQFYHFAFMAISLALLGVGASGSLLALRGRPLPPERASLGFSLAAVGGYLAVDHIPFDSFQIAWDGRQVLYLAAYFLCASLPFLAAGLVTGGDLTFAGRHGRPPGHQVYAANLLGSAAGALGSLAILKAFGAEGAVLAAAILGAVGGLCFLFRGARHNGAGASAAGPAGVALAAMLAACTALLAARPTWFQLTLSPYKSLPVLLHAYDARHTLTRWDAASRIDVVESSTIHILPGLSLASTASPPGQAALMLDGDSLMPITALDPFSAEAHALADDMPLGLPCRLRPGGRWLVLNAGTGMDAALALGCGAVSVTAVEDNPLIVEALQGEYGNFTYGLYTSDRLHLVRQNGRAYARQPGHGPFDVVNVALSDPFRPLTSGAYSLTENYTYTTEAFTDALSLLSPGGLLVVTRWLQAQPGEEARAFGMLAAALERSGLQPSSRLAAFRSMRTVTILAGRQPFSAGELKAFQSFLEERGFDAVYYPGMAPGEGNRFNVLPGERLSGLFRRILEDPQTAWREEPVDVRPATDDHPFFFHFFRWAQAPAVLAALGSTWQPFGGSGYFVVLLLLALVVLLSVLLIFGPLLLRRDAARTSSAGERALRVRALVYFASLGLAYLFVEVPLAQRLILLFGRPVTALALVVFALLFFSGLGSMAVARWRLPAGLALLVFLLAAVPLLLPPLENLAFQLPQPGRAVLVLLFLAPLGYLMGLPFAGGLRLLEGRSAGFTPWVWAVNGSFSVIASVLAVLLALASGFRLVFWLGAGFYALAWLAFLPLYPNKIPTGCG